jgi:NitT/TauT family transport system substrate-binding protein
MRKLTRREAVGAVAGGMAIWAKPALAQSLTKINVSYAASADWTGIFCAQEEGYFRAKGLDVSLQLLPLSSAVPAAVQAGSLDLAGLTPSTMLLADDGGLDLVAVTGSSFTNRKVRSYGFLERNGAGITDAKSVEGRKIAVPGLNAFLHVLFRKWVADKGGDWRKINFIEAPFVQTPDIVRGGTVDGAVTASPIMERMIASNTAQVVSYFTADLPDGIVATVLAARRDWAMGNAQVIRAFREAHAEGIAFIAKDETGARRHLEKYIQLPPDVMRTALIPFQKSEITAEEISFWIRVMQEQDMLRERMDPAKLVVSE